MSNTRRKIKTLAEKGALIIQDIGDCLVVSGAAVNLYMLLAPVDVQRLRTCEKPREKIANSDILGILKAVFIDDLGLYVFNTTLGITCIAIPAMTGAYRLVKECVQGKSEIDEESIKKLNALKENVLSALNTGLMIERLPIPSAIRHVCTGIGTGAEITRHAARSTFFSDYPENPSLPALQKAFPDQPIKAKTFAFVESILQGVNGASTMSTASGMLLNYGLNAGREVDFEGTNQLILAATLLGVALGMASICHEGAYHAVSKASTLIGMFALIANPLISELMCINPKLEDPTTYNQAAVYYVGMICAVSLGISALRTFYSPAQTQEPETKLVINDGDNMDYGATSVTVHIEDDSPIETVADLPVDVKPASPRGKK